MDVEALSDERRRSRTAKWCGPVAPTLAISRADGVSAMMGARKPGSQGERDISVKTIVQGMPGVIRPNLWVRPDGASYQWRKAPYGQLSIGPVADERFSRATGWIEAS